MSRNRIAARSRLRSLGYLNKLLQQLQRGHRRPTLRIVLRQLEVKAPKVFFQAELGQVVEVTEISPVEVGLRAPKAHGFFRGLGPGRRDRNLSKRFGRY